MKKFINRSLVITMTILMSVNTVFAQSAPEAEIKEDKTHTAYLQGYSDNTVRPQKNITREEAVSVLDRITENHKMNRRLYRYEDVKEDRWSHDSIISLSNKGGAEGYPDGTFRPEKYITRAEAVTMLARLEEKESGKSDIPEDVKGHWAEESLAHAVKEGWIKGYEDSTLRPDRYITRAEFASIVNRATGRNTNRDSIPEDIRKFSDMDRDAWWYDDIAEASNTHKYIRLEDGTEKWTETEK